MIYATDRADHDLRERMVSYLCSRFRSSLRRLDVESSGGTVTIRGRVPTYYEKQLAINSCRRVAGVVKLVDDVVVGSEEEAISS